ncbi:DUF924 family protein [Thermomonas flagellata]|uniref:DUF924 family protein n=1 Tax=Thermomonas flagellata TaxID=2888524 RepID=UPI001F04C421|nr:DUF924 family protein [Thermomonas flagellata]
MSEPLPAPAQELLAFWRDAGRARWFRGGEAFDAECRARWQALHFAAARRELDAWAGEPEAALARVLLLDQIPRNIFRGSAHAFATDGLALEAAQAMLAAGHDARIAPELRAFCYLPFEHAEDAAMQARAVALFAALGDAEYLRYARAHQEVIARFGRFPHRNAVLGRSSSDAERAWLAAGGGF